MVSSSWFIPTSRCRPHFSYPRALFAMMLLVWAGPTFAESAQDAILKFQQDTTPIVDHVHRLSQRHSQQMEQFADLLDKTQSAKAVLQSPLIGDMQRTADQMLTQADQYLTHYQSFLGHLDKDDNCYQPQRLAQFRQKRSDLQDYLQSLDSLNRVQDEADAFAALMAVNLRQNQVAMLVDLFETAKFCYIAQALPGLAQDFQALDEALIAHLPLEQAYAAAEEGSPLQNDTRTPSTKDSQKPIDSLTFTHEFKGNLVPHFNELIYLEISDIKQLQGLKLTNQLSLDDTLQLQLPQSALADPNSHYQARISATVDTEDERLELDILLVRQATQAIDALTFGNAKLDSCVKQAATLSQLQHSNALTQLNCQLSSSDTVDLNTLAQLPSLEVLSLSGGTLTNLSTLASLSHLSLLTIEQSHIITFGNLKALKGNLSFSEVDSQDWQALASTQAESIAIMSPTHCEDLKPLAKQPNVALLYKGLSPQAMADLMQRQASMQGLTIMTDCPAP